MSLMRSFGLGRANIFAALERSRYCSQKLRFSPEWTAGASKPEAYPNLQAVLTRPIAWQPDPQQYARARRKAETILKR